MRIVCTNRVSREMDAMNRARLVLSGITLTVVAIAVVLVLGADTLSAALAAPPADGEGGQSGTGESAPVSTQADLLLEELKQMEADLQDMQARETDYTAQIEEANQTIDALNTTFAQVETEARDTESALADYESQIQYANGVAGELRGSIAAMQGREGEWLAQIDVANQTIGELQTYIDQYRAAQAAAASSGGGSSGGGGGDHDDDHHDDHDDDHEDGDD
jgi:peptidoglycan hydrolase CwlO-like protein